MKTPISDFIKKYINSNPVRFHMPGHKGTEFAADITEINGADVLYSANGIIEQSQQNASSLFKTFSTLYSTEGSTLCIKAMLALVTAGKSKKRVLAARNVHKAFLYGCALLDIEPIWIYPDKFTDICSCTVFPEQVESILKGCEELPSAVYITSPDYLGEQTDIGGISRVCKTYGVPLLVDNAHGAYTAFLSKSEHPIHLGADMCCDSAHKTLPVLTGGAYLHISESAKKYAGDAKNALSIFASTSPSYLILESLDRCNEYLAKDYKAQLEKCVFETEKARKLLCGAGYQTAGSEKTKLTVLPNQKGYTGTEIDAVLNENGIYAEYADFSHIVFMLTPFNSSEDIQRLTDLLTLLEDRPPISPKELVLPRGEYVFSPRKAILGETESVPVSEAVGRVCACPAVSCPPAVPIVMSGERITEEIALLLKYYKTNTVQVTKKSN